MKAFLAAAFATLLLPALVSGQESDVSRRSYTFLDDRLVVHVLGGAPGELQLVRGERGRIEVAARSRDGFPGFGLGGNITRELRLTAVGAELVRFLVVVPEHVRVTVQLPDGSSASVPSRMGAASYRWGDGSHADSALEPDLPVLPTLANGMYLVHAAAVAPTLVDIPELAAVRTISLRFEGADFRIVASRPLTVSPGRGQAVELLIGGEPVDLVLYVPRGNARFQLRSGTLRLVESVAGRPRALCGNVVIQRPTPHQDWITFHPQTGRLDCR
jgi:hypothetical protein